MKPGANPPPIAYRYWWDTMPEKGEDWLLRGEFNELSDRSLTEQPTTIRCRGALADGEIAVISVLRNEAARLPLFFEHYKRLGATRFFMVDNNSDDGSHEILLAEPMADVFHTTTPYKQGQMGVYWYNGLARAFCRDHWTVSADADELLVYDGMEEHDLHHLGRWLDHYDFDRLYALMVDVYPSGDIGKGSRSIKEILATDCWFDEFGYRLERKKAGNLITGGVRHRLFNKGAEVHDHWLSKYPFFRMNEDTAIFDAHFLWPYNEQPPGPMSALIHLKLMDDFAARSKVAQAELQHVENSNAYRIINERFAENPQMAAHNEESCRYQGPQSLIDHRVMQAIDWTLNDPFPHRFILEPARYWGSSMPMAGANWPRKGHFNELCHQALRHQLKVVRSQGELREDDFPLICVLRNEAKRLPLFLEHYKKLGITRFIMIDNNSEDGSRDILLAEPSADVYHAIPSFRDGCYGIYWQNGIARQLCIDRWVMVVDADELFIYDGMEARGLADLALLLEARGQDRVLSMQLDVYPTGAIGRGDRSIEEILAIDCYFDGDGYETRRDRPGWAIRGGVRARLFKQEDGPMSCHLSKFPFFHMKEQTVIWSSHYLWPYDQVDRKPESILLHLKFMDDFVARAQVNVAENQHWKNSIYYRELAKAFESAPEIVALHKNSQRYRGPKSLIRHHLMKPLRWGGQ